MKRAVDLFFIGFAAALFGPPLAVLALSTVLFALIGWLPTLLALSAGNWPWGFGLLVTWAICCGLTNVLTDC